MNSMWAECLHCRTRQYITINQGLVRIFYCQDCSQICMECGELRPLNNFPYDYKSQTYKDYFANMRGNPPKAAFTTVCQQCTHKLHERLEIAEQIRRQNDPAIQEMVAIMTRQ